MITRIPLLPGLAALLLALLLTGCERRPSILEQVKTSGELRVATRNGPTTFYEGPEGPAGMEYELIVRFAESLGVKPRFVVIHRFEDIIPTVVNRDVHLAAAGLTVTGKRQSLVRFTRPYQTITQQLVYRAGERRPRRIDDLKDGHLEVVAGSSHEERLLELKEQHPDLSWTSNTELGVEQLLKLVREAVIDYSVADSNDLALNRRFYPELRPAFNLSKPQHLAWALPHTDDSSLYRAAEDFFEQIEKDGTLAQLIERYYGHVDRLNFVDKRTFGVHVAQRLPIYRDTFEAAAKATGLDWRLLAAIGYQESHWDPDAVSPTGVRGIMMLTRATARQLGVEDRTSPQESIFGGARYVKRMEEKVPDRIPEPDRLWMALAGYNVGFGHLEDARVLTERQGGDPDKWADVKKRLPMLSQKKYYKNLKHGYARGSEPVTYVDNIRSYYDLLVWHMEQQQSPVEDYLPIESRMPSAL